MTRRLVVSVERLLALAAVVALSIAPVALGTPAGRRPPPAVAFCNPEFLGKFVGGLPGARSSFVHLCPGDSATLVVFRGMVPATCRDAQGRTHGPAKGVSVQFDALPRTPIRPDGSFAFSARSPGGRVLGAPKATLHVRGVFDGTTVKGRVRIESGAWSGYTTCSGNARFQARIEPR